MGTLRKASPLAILLALVVLAALAASPLRLGSSTFSTQGERSAPGSEPPARPRKLPNAGELSTSPATLVAPRRIAFRIRTLLGPEGERITASDATVEGPLDTDLTLRSKAGGFTLAAQVKTDLLASGRLRLVADLTTRRSVGRSERGLPLFEEDTQRRVVELAADGSQSLVVLPFGRNPGGEELALDLLPRLTGQPAAGGHAAPQPPEIRIARVGPDGWLKIEATRSLHHFRVEAKLERQGRTVALGSAPCALIEPCTLLLSPPPGSRREPLASIDLTVTRTIYGCPAPQVALDFDLRGTGSGGAPRGGPAATAATAPRRDSGIGLAGVPLVYPLGELGASLPGQPDTLQLTVIPEDLP
jgi:hypothetical protein